MSTSAVQLLDDFIPRAFRDRPPEVAGWFYDYFAELEDPTARRRYVRALTLDLKLARVTVADRVVVDAGSGFGVTLLVLAALGARTALGLEAFAPMAASAAVLRRRFAPDLPAHTLRCSVQAAPLAPGSCDFIYCNEALSHFRDPSAFLAEAARVLRPGGTLMVCDGNNALNGSTVAAVHEVWHRFEEGPPGDDVHGHRIEVPYRQMRKRRIEAALPGIAPEVVEKLAWGTFGLAGDEVDERARDLLAGGRLPDAPPVVDTFPVDPEKGDRIENLIDPHALAAELRGLGFDPRVHAHFGGARGPLIEAANRLLRAATPLTLPWARSFKVVATRR